MLKAPEHIYTPEGTVMHVQTLQYSFLVGARTTPGAPGQTLTYGDW